MIIPLGIPGHKTNFAMKNSATLFSLIIFFSFVFINNTVAQLENKSGAWYCSQKKQHSHNQVNRVLGPNSPAHSFDVLKYTMEIDLFNNFD